MEIFKQGTRYENYKNWETRLNTPYDYEKDGLMRHLLSHVILESNNETLRMMISYIEEVFIKLLKFTERLKNFKNYSYFKY